MPGSVNPLSLTTLSPSLLREAQQLAGDRCEAAPHGECAERRAVNRAVGAIVVAGALLLAAVVGLHVGA